MGFLDTLLGRTPPASANLDALFAVPSAAYTVQAAIGAQPTGRGAVCFKTAQGAGARRSTEEILGLLGLEPSIETSVLHDGFGFTWIVCRQRSADLAELVTALHAVNSTLSDNGFGTSLLCTVIGFTMPAPAEASRFGLVYLFKRGTFYPFAPTGANQRDTALEMRVRAALAGELPLEADLERWFALWDAPVP